MRLINAFVVRLLFLTVVSGATVYSVGLWRDWDGGFRLVILVMSVIVCLLVIVAELVSAVIDWRERNTVNRGV